MPGLLQRVLGRRRAGQRAAPSPSPPAHRRDEPPDVAAPVAPPHRGSPARFAPDAGVPVRAGSASGQAPSEAPTAVTPAVAPTQSEPERGAPASAAFASAPATSQPGPEPPTAPAEAEPDSAPSPPSWRARGQLRRRLRFVRRARELALRDLGGLVLDMHRFGRERRDLVAAKVAALTALDQERRTLEHALADRRDVDLLRVPGIADCPRCGVLHPTEAHFCASCGLLLKPAAGLPAGALSATQPERATEAAEPVAVAIAPAANADPRGT